MLGRARRARRRWSGCCSHITREWTTGRCKGAPHCGMRPPPARAMRWIALLARRRESGGRRCPRAHACCTPPRHSRTPRCSCRCSRPDAASTRAAPSGDTPLLIAAATGHAEVVQALLARSPGLDVQNKAGDTALIAASRGGYAAICHLLVGCGRQPGAAQWRRRVGGRCGGRPRIRIDRQGDSPARPMERCESSVGVIGSRCRHRPTRWSIPI